MWRIRYIITSISNLFYYFKVVWNDRDWDHAYIDYLLETKLKKVLKRYQKKNYFVGQDKVIQQLRICLEILKRSRESFYIKTWKLSDLKNKYNNKVINADRCEERDIRNLFKIMEKYYQTWWD